MVSGPLGLTSGSASWVCLLGNHTGPLLDSVFGSHGLDILFFKKLKYRGFLLWPRGLWTRCCLCEDPR